MLAPARLVLACLPFVVTLPIQFQLLPQTEAESFSAQHIRKKKVVFLNIAEVFVLNVKFKTDYKEHKTARLQPENQCFLMAYNLKL